MTKKVFLTQKFYYAHGVNLGPGIRDPRSGKIIIPDPDPRVEKDWIQIPTEHDFLETGIQTHYLSQPRPVPNFLSASWLVLFPTEMNLYARHWYATLVWSGRKVHKIATKH